MVVISFRKAVLEYRLQLGFLAESKARLKSVL